MFWESEPSLTEADWFCSLAQRSKGRRREWEEWDEGKKEGRRKGGKWGISMTHGT